MQGLCRSIIVLFVWVRRTSGDMVKEKQNIAMVLEKFFIPWETFALINEGCSIMAKIIITIITVITII